MEAMNAGASGRQIADVLSQRGLRPTQQRIAVYQYLLKHPIHPTVDTIYQALSGEYPSFSRTTIYNSVYALVEAKLVRRITIDAEEQRFDGNPAEHGHFKCRHCGEVFDFQLDSQQIHRLCPSAFEAETCDVFFNGVCPDCVQLSQSQK